MEGFDHIVKHGTCEAGINTKPEDLMHYIVGSFKLADHTIVLITIRGLVN